MRWDLGSFLLGLSVSGFIYATTYILVVRSKWWR
jgi:hypothetical protein